MKIEIEREADDRWIAEVPDLPGVMVYGQTRAEAIAKVEALALRVIADRLTRSSLAAKFAAAIAGPRRSLASRCRHGRAYAAQPHKRFL